ncbi:hypothetical protein JTB14_035739 [Gonioctena quinquepunctata]|nr:hypothetical protein JTB14_035739 [Gonioctena quinquepunctata]
MFRIATSSLLFLIVCAKCDSINNCDSVECLDKELIQYIDGLDEGGDIGDFIAITKINSSVERVHREEDIIGRCSRYLAEHELKLRIPLSEARSLEAGKDRTKISANHKLGKTKK